MTVIRHARIHQSMRADRISEHGNAHNRDHGRSSSSRCREPSNRCTSSHLASSIHVFIGEGRSLDATKPRRKIVYRNHIVRVLGQLCHNTPHPNRDIVASSKKIRAGRQPLDGLDVSVLAARIVNEGLVSFSLLPRILSTLTFQVQVPSD